MEPQKYPRCKYSLENMQGVLVQNEAEERKLGRRWFDHPLDAAAGRVLTNAERGGGEAAQAPVDKASDKSPEKPGDKPVDDPKDKQDEKSAKV